jgi:predicted dehydrogenase
MRVKIGIIGCGQVAHFHVKGLQSTEADIVALADVDESHAMDLAAKTGDVSVYRDYGEMLNAAEIDSVIIGVRNNMHYQVVSDCLDSGLAIFCEKPLTASAEESADLVKKVDEAGNVFMMGFMKRHHTAFRRVKSLVEEFGDILHARISQCIHVPVENIEAKKLLSEWWGWNRQFSRGGSLVHSGSHELDLIRWLLCEPSTITANFKFVPELKGMDHYCAAMLEMDKGFSTLVDFTAMPYSAYGAGIGGWIEVVEIYCEKGWVKLTNHTWDGSAEPELIVYEESNGSITEIDVGPSLQWENEMQHFIHCIQNNLRPTPGIIDGYRVDQIISDAYRSAEEDRKVHISYVC